MNNCRLCGRVLAGNNFKDVFIETLAEQTLCKVIKKMTHIQIYQKDKYSKKICEKCFCHMQEWIHFLKECKKTQESLALIAGLKRQAKTKKLTITLPEDDEVDGNMLSTTSASFECEHCPRTFDNRQRWYKHKVWHRDRGQFQCEKCAKIFHTKRSLETHLLTHEDKKEFCCHVCGTLFRTAPGLLNHVSIHKERTFVCPIDDCGKLFRHRHTLDNHLKWHTGERPFVCPHCSFAFPFAIKLERHIQAVHTKMKRFTCPTCNKQFLYVNNYKDHLLRHEGIKKAKCEECGKCFVTNDHLLRHKRSHTKEKPFRCDICGRMFADSSNRKRHVLRHSDDAKREMQRREREAARRRKMEEKLSRRAKQREGKVAATGKRKQREKEPKILEEPEASIIVVQDAKIHKQNNISITPTDEKIIPTSTTTVVFDENEEEIGMSAETEILSISPTETVILGEQNISILAENATATPEQNVIMIPSDEDDFNLKSYSDLKNFLESTEIVETLGNNGTGVVDDVATLLYSDSYTEADLERLRLNQVIQVVIDPIFQNV